MSEAERLAAQVVNDCDHLDCNVVGACRTCVSRALAAERARAIAACAEAGEAFMGWRVGPQLAAHLRALLPETP